MKRIFYALLCAMLMCCAFLFVACDDEKDHEHSYTEEITTPATCTETGVKTLKCSCGDVKTEVIPATGHSYGTWQTVTAATCGAKGQKKQTCLGCGDVKTADIPATGHHNYTTEEIIMNPKCGEVGTKKLICACGEFKYESIPATGNHNYENGTCTGCGMTDPSACTHTEWEDATCTTPKTCKGCGMTEGEALGHNYGEWQTETAANCTDPGVKKQICSGCGDIKREPIPATGKHTFENGTCTGCGAAASAISNEEYISSAITGGASSGASEIVTIIDALKKQYDEMPEIPTVDIDAMLAQINMYLKANITGEGETVISVKNGYVTYTDENGNYYVGYNKGYLVVTDGEKVVNYTEIIPEFLMNILSGNFESIPAEQIDTMVEMIKTMIPVLFTEIGTVTPDEIVVEDGWYTLDLVAHFIKVYNADDSALKELIHSLIGDEDMQAQVDAMIEQMLSTMVSIKVGVTMNGKIITGVRFDVAIYGMSHSEAVPDGDHAEFSADGADSADGEFDVELVESISFVVKLSDDGTRLESIKATVIAVNDDETMKLDCETKAIYGTDGSLTFTMTIDYKMFDEEQTYMIGNIAFSISFNADMNPTEFSIKMNDLSYGDRTKIEIKGTVTYTENGATMHVTFDGQQGEDDDIESTFNVSSDVVFDKNAMPVKYTFESNMVDYHYSTSGGYSIEIPGTNYSYTWVEGEACMTVKVKMSIDITKLNEGEASFSFEYDEKYTDKKIIVDKWDHYGLSEATKQAIIASLTTEQKAGILGNPEDGSYAFSFTMKDNTYTLKMTSREYYNYTICVAIDSEASKGTISITQSSADGDTTVTVGIDVNVDSKTGAITVKNGDTTLMTINIKLDSEEATVPSQDIIDIIKGFTPPENGEIDPDEYPEGDYAA